MTPSPTQEIVAHLHIQKKNRKIPLIMSSIHIWAQHIILFFKIKGHIFWVLRRKLEIPFFSAFEEMSQKLKNEVLVIIN